MSIKYRECLKEYELTLESDVLDPAFVAKANDFETRLAAKELTTDQVTELDNELCEMFNKLHDFTEVPAEEVVKANHEKSVAEAKAAIAEAETVEALNALEVQYGKEIPEVMPLIEKKLKKMQKALDDDALKVLYAEADKEIAACPYDNLQAMGEKYKAYPELVSKIKKRHEDEKPAQQNAELAEKLKAKKEWSYKELEALGIKPTGNNMVVAGVKLEKEYLFNIYSVRR